MTPIFKLWCPSDALDSVRISIAPNNNAVDSLEGPPKAISAASNWTKIDFDSKIVCVE